MNGDASGEAMSDVVQTTDDSAAMSAPWVAAYEERKRHVIDAASSVQEELDPSDTFSCLPEAQKSRLTKALVRFFLMKQGVAPSVPILREDIARLFETARREANLVSTPKLFPYFLQEAKKKLAETCGFEIRECEKRIPSEDAKRRKSAKPPPVYYVLSLLPPEMRVLFMEPKEKELQAVMKILIRLVLAADGKLSKAEAIDLLTRLDFRQSLCHETFGNWESVIFAEAIKKRLLIESRRNPGQYELGEAAFLEMSAEEFTDAFTRHIL